MCSEIIAMGTKEKLIERFKQQPKDFSWEGLVRKRIDMKTLNYKGYIGSIEISEKDNCSFGKVLDLPKNTMITYEGETVAELKKDFQGAVNDYAYIKQALDRQVATIS